MVLVLYAEMKVVRGGLMDVVWDVGGCSVAFLAVLTVGEMFIRV